MSYPNLQPGLDRNCTMTGGATVTADVVARATVLELSIANHKTIEELFDNFIGDDDRVLLDGLSGSCRINTDVEDDVWVGANLYLVCVENQHTLASTPTAGNFESTTDYSDIDLISALISTGAILEIVPIGQIRKLEFDDGGHFLTSGGFSVPTKAIKRLQRNKCLMSQEHRTGKEDPKCYLVVILRPLTASQTFGTVTNYQINTWFTWLTRQISLQKTRVSRP